MASKPKNTKGRNTGNSNRKSNSKSKRNTGKNNQNVSFQNEVILLIILAVCIILFISNFGFGGFVGEAVSSFCFGLFGIIAYLFPICFFVGAAFLVSNRDNWVAFVKIVAGIVLVMFLCLLMELLTGSSTDGGISESFQYASEHKQGGGAVGGILSSMLCPAIGRIGTYVVDIIALIISLVLLTERSFLAGVKRGSRKVYDNAKEDAARRREVKETRKEEWAQRRTDRKVEGVALNTKITPINAKHSDNISELKISEENGNVSGTSTAMEIPAMSGSPQISEIATEPVVVEKVHRKQKRKNPAIPESNAFEMDDIAETVIPFEMDDITETVIPFEMDDITETVIPFEMDDVSKLVTPFEVSDTTEPDIPFEPDNMKEPESFGSADHTLGTLSNNDNEQSAPALQAEVAARHKYVFPPVSLLEKGNGDRGDTKKHLQETALKLQQILKNFGVNVTITDVSCGPSVTRYELQPEMGVKVSKIVNLTDDIKLNLAATDIRIEAPIPGKAAVGIEVPNKEKVMVRFRDMIESTDFQNHKSNICFTAGKDIGGQVVVADIAKMPHLLIAGATGSGKSVCINTIIMSILYKADPEDVKLILIDPKVVELSVYNGIPHLLIPVVTDPKKAAGALHWAVAEMDDRYKKFADYQVRDLKGYNQKVASIADVDDETKPQKMPQIIVIVDELADLMMVAPGDVEDAICRLAQLARAAGIHLIIATQRPSVDVITGLIKANMPSRIAFSVSSGVDSRTILDMVGAEKLLGNGDMLFYPQGVPKPQRVQGPFVSDNEVEAVVDFLKKQSTVVYSEEIEEKMNTVSIGSASGSAAGSADSRDAYFVDAGKFVIEKDKGSIGMLQRVFRIGFNRAARIMDQLEEAGVVGAEEGTKPRKILMSMEEFESYVEES